MGRIAGQRIRAIRFFVAIIRGDAETIDPSASTNAKQVVRLRRKATWQLRTDQFPHVIHGRPRAAFNNGNLDNGNLRAIRAHSQRIRLAGARKPFLWNLPTWAGLLGTDVWESWH